MEILSELRLANVRNGLAYPHHDLCYFQSNHGHRASLGYLRIDAMPLRAVVHLLLGSRIVIIDGTAKSHRISDALRFGVPTWCAAYNHALGFYRPPCDWISDHAMEVARSPLHRPLRHNIQKLAELYASVRSAPPARIGVGQDYNVVLECHLGIEHDDRPERLRVYRS